MPPATRAARTMRSSATSLERRRARVARASSARRAVPVTSAGAGATRVNVPSDAPSNALDALRAIEVMRAVDGARVTVPDVVGARGTVVVQFLRSFG
jgi:hypothetical protein